MLSNKTNRSVDIDCFSRKKGTPPKMQWQNEHKITHTTSIDEDHTKSILQLAKPMKTNFITNWNGQWTILKCPKESIIHLNFETINDDVSSSKNRICTIACVVSLWWHTLSNQTNYKLQSEIRKKTTTKFSDTQRVTSM